MSRSGPLPPVSIRSHASHRSVLGLVPRGLRGVPRWCRWHSERLRPRPELGSGGSDAAGRCFTRGPRSWPRWADVSHRNHRTGNSRSHCHCSFLEGDAYSKPHLARPCPDRGRQLRPSSTRSNPPSSSLGWRHLATKLGEIALRALVLPHRESRKIVRTKRIACVLDSSSH